MPAICERLEAFASPPAGLCCWPVGSPRSTGFRFCAAAVDVPHRYCPEHARRSRAKPGEHPSSVVRALERRPS